MYNTQEIAKRIKNTSKTQNEPLGTMLSNLELGINTVSELGKGKQISYLNFAKIADYLNVSVDYLLGRTDEPQTIKGHLIQTGNIGNYSSHSDTSVKIDDNNKHLDETSKELINAFGKLGLGDKAKVMSLIAELSNKEVK